MAKCLRCNLEVEPIQGNECPVCQSSLFVPFQPKPEPKAEVTPTVKAKAKK